MRHLIVGTAGHIDHGKSALVRSLTGTDPDRLPEEKARGITIDLGFADLDLGEGRIVSFVDVPGHERFVRHMVAGATGIDCVILVIAADDGVRPQTREHLDICTLLQIPYGIVALTKIDLLDSELRQVAELEVREFLEGSFLATAPVVAVSSRTGEGMPQLRERIAEAFDVLPERPHGGVARLPVHRSFVLHGFGTVVTGTLASGSLAEGDEVEVLPGGKRGRVRGLQVHRQRVESVRAGQRTAVNVQGLHRDEVPRGATLCRPGTVPVTRRAWARVRLLADAPATLRKGGPVRFHQGTCERAARLKFLDPDTSDLAEITLRQETVLLPGDAFILRRPAPVDTVGGGVIEDVRPPARKTRGAAARAERHDLDSSLLERLLRAGASGLAVGSLAGELGLLTEELRTRVDRLESVGRVTRAGGHVIVSDAFESLRQDVVRDLRAFHLAQPLEPGRSREELRGRVARDVPQEIWRTFLERLVALGDLRLEKNLAALKSHEVKLTGPELAAARRLEALYRDAGLDPPDPDEAAKSEGLTLGRRLLRQLEAEGSLAKIRDGRYFHAEALAALRDKLRAHAGSHPTIDVATFKEIAGVTRKNAIPLLEQLDAERFTRRVGNIREILARPADESAERT